VTTQWSLDIPRARLQSASFSASLALTLPTDGLIDAVVTGRHLRGGKWLGIAWPDPGDKEVDAPSDVYARGTDLVATFSETPQRPVQVDALWRVAEGADTSDFITAIELLVSVGTSRLDSRPELFVQSVVPAGEVLRLVDLEGARFEPTGPAVDRGGDPGIAPWECYLFRLSDGDGAEGPISYAQMVHPADSSGDPPSRLPGESSRTFLRHRLFAEPLEKGVIRRARLRGVFLPRQNDQQRTAAYFQDFVSAEPPLGT